MSDQPRFVLIAEDRAHAWLAITLADRLAAETIAWLADHKHSETSLLPTYLRIFAPTNVSRALRLDEDAPPGAEPLAYFLRKHDISELYKAAGVPHITHRPGINPHIRNMVKALRYFKDREAKASALIYMTDTDGHANAGHTLNELREAAGPNYFPEGFPFSIVFGVCHPEAEAWFLCAWTPQNPEEQQRLRAETQHLGFNPCEHGERLGARKPKDKKDAKRVLGALLDTQPDTAFKHERALQALRTSPLADLRKRGRDIGLDAFVGELGEYLVPKYHHLPPPR